MNKKYILLAVGIVVVAAVAYVYFGLITPVTENISDLDSTLASVENIDQSASSLESELAVGADQEIPAP